MDDMPATGSHERINTAAADPSSPVTILSMWWRP
jgi:hypothetical protein